MHVRTTLALCAFAFSLGGCISIIDDSPKFNVPVTARAVTDIPPPAEVAALASQAAPLISRPDRPAPARTDIRGAGDGARNPDLITVTADAEDVRHTVADFSGEQIATMVCGARDAKALARGVKAWEATLAVKQARRDWDARLIKLKPLNDAERARQDAVKAFRGDNSFLIGLLGGLQRKKDLPKPEAGPLVLENIDVFTFIENGVSVMAVSGVIRNRDGVATDVPPITLQSIDQWDFLLAGQTSLLPFETLGPNESRTFEIRFLNPPETLAEVYAHFAPPFEYRAFRACGENFDPRTATPAPRREDRPEPTGPIHTAAELNELTRFYREQAQNSWTCRNGEDGVADRGGGLRTAISGSGERLEGGSISLGSPNLALLCAGWRERLRWRDMFQLGEATDEAWALLRARENTEVRRVPRAELDAAIAAQDRAYAYVKTLGQAALARAGASTPGVEVALGSAAFISEKGGRHLTVSGSVRNAGSEPRTVDSLMLAIVDRLEMPLMTFAIPNPATLAPGASTTFTHTIRLNVSPPETGKWGDSPDWQVRIGAVGK